MKQRKEYSAPTVRSWGTVTEVTEGGYSHPKSDLKHGSSPTKGY